MLLPSQEASRSASYLRLDFRGGAALPCQLTIVGGGREAPVVCGRGTLSILRARGRWLAWSRGPSTSPLDVRCETSCSLPLLGLWHRSLPAAALIPAASPYLIATPSKSWRAAAPL